MSHRARALVIVLGALVALAVVTGATSVWQADPVSAESPTVIARGEYLATAGPCRECHTVRRADNPGALDLSKAFAGGEEFALPFGTLFSANITPDPETGIGNMSDEQIKSAIRDGIGKDGRKLILHPSAQFRGLADADLNALVAFLKSLAPIKNAVPAAQLQAPRDALFVPPAGTGAAAVPEGGKALGEYLTRNLLGCVECHTPGAMQGKPDFSQFLGSPNLTPDTATGLGTWSKEDISRAIREGVRPDGRALSPIMPSHTAYVNLTDKDTYAVIDYLQGLTPVTLGQPGGERLYQVNCGRCHGLNGEGGFGPPLGGAAEKLQQMGIPLEQAGAALTGLVRQGLPPVMPSFTPEQLSDADVAAIAQHMLTLPPPPAPPGPPTGAPQAGPAPDAASPTTAPAASPSASAAPSPAASAPSALPRTGEAMPTGLVVAGGAMLLALGLALRRMRARV